MVYAGRINRCMLSHRVYLQFIQLVLPLLSLALSDGSIQGALVSQITVACSLVSARLQTYLI